MSHRSSGKEKTGKSSRHRTAGFCIFIGIIIIAILAFCLDLMYHGVIACCPILRNGYHFLSTWTGVTYQSALDLLSGTVGVVMTMVSLILATGINLVQRGEVCIYGIPRSELKTSDNYMYQKMGRICYLAPLLIVFFLNFSMCISGYLLYIYCYVFLCLHHLKYRQSYNEKRNRDALVSKIIEEYQIENIEDGIWNIQIYFEKIKEYTVESGKWNQMTILYQEMLDKISNEDMNRRYILSSTFFYYVFFRGKKKNETGAVSFIRDFIAEFDRKCAVVFTDPGWVELFAILEIAIMEMEEVCLLELLNLLKDFASREKKSSITENIIQRQRTMVCVLLECRLQNPLVDISISMANMLSSSWNELTTDDYINELEMYSGFRMRYSKRYFSLAIHNLILDYEKTIGISALGNIALIVGGRT
jgi:hypothetical protein